MTFGISTTRSVLDSFCTVTVFTDGQDVDGSPKRSVSELLYENLPCAIRPNSSRRGVEQGRILQRAQYTAYFPTHTTAGQAVTFGNDAEVAAGGVTYRPVGPLIRDISLGSPMLRCDLEAKP